VWGIPFVVGLARSGAEPLSGPLRVGNSGQVAEWFKAAVLKTAVGGSSPWVRIPPCPPKIIENVMFSWIMVFLSYFCLCTDLGRGVRSRYQAGERTRQNSRFRKRLILYSAARARKALSVVDSARYEAVSKVIYSAFEPSALLPAGHPSPSARISCRNIHDRSSAVRAGASSN
jgi:hypothetical protein